MDEYNTNVDVDGDGTFDEVEFTENSDGSVTITADMNNDGVDDFIAQDVDRDGLVEGAAYDENHDGTLDTAYTDVDGDGYLDTSFSIEQSSETGLDPSATDQYSGSGASDVPISETDPFTNAPENPAEAPSDNYSDPAPAPSEDPAESELTDEDSYAPAEEAPTEPAPAEEPTDGAAASDEKGLADDEASSSSGFPGAF